MFVFLFVFGVFGLVGKLLGGLFNVLKGNSSSFSDNRSSREEQDREEGRMGQSETGVRRMKRFKSWAEDASFEESGFEEKVEMEEPLREEMMNK